MSNASGLDSWVLPSAQKITSYILRSWDYCATPRAIKCGPRVCEVFAKGFGRSLLLRYWRVVDNIGGYLKYKLKYLGKHLKSRETLSSQSGRCIPPNFYFCQIAWYSQASTNPCRTQLHGYKVCKGGVLLCLGSLLIAIHGTSCIAIAWSMWRLY